MGCGSSTATRTAVQPAPKLKRIKEEEENVSQSSSKERSSSRPVNESNGPAERVKSNKESGDESSTKPTGKVVTPPSSANGHVPHDSQENTSSGGGVLASAKQTNEETVRGAADGAPHVEENADELDNTAPENSGTSAQENQFKKEESFEDGAPASNGKATAGVDSGAVETDLPQHRIASEGSLLGEIETTPVVDQSKRASIDASEHSAAPSDNDVNLSRQNRGSLELDSVSPAPAESAQPTQPREISQEDSASLAEKERSFPVEASRFSQPTEVSGKDSVPLDMKDSVSHHAAASNGFLLKSERIDGRICTLTASVQIGSLDDPQGERTVTLHGSVYRLPSVTTPRPGDKIGFVTGDVTSTPVDNESSSKVATLRGDLLAVSGEAASQGQIATASIDVLSCANGEKIAMITADVAPNDDSDSASGVISGEVLGASESGSCDEKIGTLAGKVVALTFDEDTISISSSDEEFLKQRRESCFI